MVKELPLQNGMVALVDDEDFERCSQYTWTAQKKKTNYDVVSRVGSVHKSLGDFVMQKEKQTERVVRKDKKNFDYTKDNLEILTAKEASYSTKGHRNTSSKYKGVCKVKGANKFVAGIGIGTKRKHLGTFDSEEEAAIAYNKAAKLIFGEKAYLNRIGEENNSEEPETLNRIVSRRFKGNTSVFRGVYLNKGKWNAQIKKGRKSYFLYRGENEEEAARAYDRKALELHGKKAILNFPELKETYLKEIK